MEKSRPGVAVGRRIVVAAVVAVVVRGLAWPFSLFMVGPILGTATFGLLNDGPLGTSGPLVAEGGLVLLSIVAAGVVAAGVRDGEARWFGRARVLGWVVVADTVFYLGSVIVALLVSGGWPALADLSWAVAVLAAANLPLIWLGVSVAATAGTRVAVTSLSP